MKILITGQGAISTLGQNVPEHIDALLNARTGIKQGTRDYSKSTLVGEVPGLKKDLIEKHQLLARGSRTTLFGAIAAKEAFAQHSIDTRIKTGVISGTSVGGMDLSEIIYRDMQVDSNSNISLFANHPSGDSTEQIAQELGILGYTNTISTACSSASNAIIMGARMIQQGLLDRVVVGGTDALSEFTIAGFKSLMIYDSEWCKPFDENRKGLNLGEGAGFLVLESEKSNSISKAPILGVLKGWGSTSDAYHQTASSPEGVGAQLAMVEALKMANISAHQIDYLNAHGTATPNNDLTESKAIKHVFGENIPPFSSTKPQTGHTLAACGGIEAIFCLIALDKQMVLPNLNCQNTIIETDLIPVKRLESNHNIRHVMSNNFGFGGNCTTLIFEKA